MSFADKINLEFSNIVHEELNKVTELKEVNWILKNKDDMEKYQLGL